MNWKDLNSGKTKDSKANARATEERLVLEQAFKRCFGTEDGKTVLQHLSQQFIYGNDVPLESNNITYVAGYKNGEAGSIKYIIHLLVERQDVRQKEA